MAGSNSVVAGEDGFTLIEVIVSFLILALVLGSTTISVSHAVRLYKKSDDLRAARELAETVLAEKFNTKPGQKAAESAQAEKGFAWQIKREILVEKFAGDGGALMSFRLVILGKGDQVLDDYSTMYVEHRP